MPSANDPFGKAARGLASLDLGEVERFAAGGFLGTASAAFGAQEKIAEQVNFATGSFGLHETASDRMFRDLAGGSLIDRAMRDAAGGGLASEMAKLYPKPSATELAITKTQAEMNGDRIFRDLAGGSLFDRDMRDVAGGGLASEMAKLYPKPSATELAITKTQAEMAGLINGRTQTLIDGSAVDGGALATARKMAEGSFGHSIAAETASAFASKTIGTSAAKTVAMLAITRYAGADLASSVLGFRSSFNDRYDRILRDVAGVGSLGSIAAGLATNRDATAVAASRLFDDVGARIASGLAGATGSAMRRAHADLFAPMRPATRSEIDAIVGMTSTWTTLSPYSDWIGRVQASFDDLGSAWVREDRPELSIEAMTRFAHLGGVVANLDPREAAVTAELRARFGDYRLEEPSEAAAEDPLLRVAEQYDRGFDATLSSLPTRVVVAMLEPFGLRFDADAAGDEFELDDLIGRMLRRLERRLMAFVQCMLETHYGDEWIMQVPGDYRSQMRRRRRKDEEEGREPSHLIAYADFDWWAGIIGYGENWSLFTGTFGSLDSLKETMARIKPIRHAASHPRVLALEDLIMLAADGRRLLRWIGREH